jgi:hypothetical protein
MLQLIYKIRRAYRLWKTLFANKNKIDSLENSIVIYDNQDKLLYKAEEIRTRIIFRRRFGSYHAMKRKLCLL